MPFVATTSTVTPLAAPPVRLTVTVAVELLSATDTDVARNDSAPPTSLFVIVSVAVLGLPSVAPPPGSLRSSPTVLLPSPAVVFPWILTVNVAVAALPRNCSVVGEIGS